MSRVTPSSLDTTRYQAVVPDTLDLAERGRVAVGGFTGTADPEHGYEAYHCANLAVRPAYMTHVGDQNCEPKILEALSVLRAMSGSEVNRDVEDRMLGRLLEDIEDDGLWWMKPDGRPWIYRPLEQPTVDIMGNSRLILALLSKHRWDGDSACHETAGKLARGLMRIATRDGDAAIYPLGRYLPDGTWKQHPVTGNADSFYTQGNVLRALSNWYAASGDDETVHMAHKVAAPLLSPERWRPLAGPWMVAEGERAHWSGHFHSTTVVALALIEYAIACNDAQVMRLVRDFYEYSRSFGLSRLGFFPAVVAPREQLAGSSWEERAAHARFAATMEGCCLADMLCIALRLTASGVGDYWDDIDQYVRNHLVELQLLDRDLIREISQAGVEREIVRGSMTDDDVIDRVIGTFASCAEPTAIYPLWTMCCVGNLGVALGEAWESIVRGQDGTAQVNLLLNRCSPWLDVDSHLPYQGKVVLTNKSAKRVYIRVPLWVDKSALRCRAADRERRPIWLGQHLLLDGLQPGEQITLEFPVADTAEHHTEPTYAVSYTMRLRGNTVVDISPRPGSPAFPWQQQDDGVANPVKRFYPIYRRAHLLGDEAPLIERTRVVHGIGKRP